jgi:tetratricopeptide (TPR) repeat protein
VEALAHFYRAIELDPNFASAYGMAARCYSQRKANGWAIDRAEEMAETRRLAQRAGQLGKDDAFALCTAGLGLAYVAGDVDEGDAFIDRALVLNPNLAWAWLFSGWVKTWLGEPEVAIERLARAMRLSPQDVQFFNMQTGTGAAHFVAGRYAEALSWAGAATRDQPDYVLSQSVVAASGALCGRLAEARKAMMRLRQLEPALGLANLRNLIPLQRPEDFTRWADGLRMAGLPE